MTSMLKQYFNIRPSELAPILMAALYFFFILTTLMILRPARDALGMQAGIDAIRWLFMGTLVATLLVNPVFGWLVSKFRRLTFITATNAFFGINLLIFAGLLAFAEEAVGITSGNVFYVWMSVFNLFLTMIFWALMADRFSLEQSKRLFGVIAVGGTAGAIFGSAIAWQLAETVGAPMLLVIAAFFLVLAIVAAWGVARLQPERKDIAEDDPDAPPVVSENAVIGGAALQGFRAVFKSPYLLGIAAYVLILAVIVTFVYFTRLQMVAALGDDVDMRTGVFAQLDLATQIATLVLQLVVAGHVMKRLGVHVALVLAPVTAALGFIGLAMVASLTLLVIFDAIFRAIQRAIMRPARETLFTVVSREDKYKAKAFIDTFVYRGGDAMGAQTEGLLARLGMGLYALTLVVVPMAIAWAALGLWLGRQQSKLAGNKPAEPSEINHTN
ncbi:MAG: MFS transporter [Gammaproteobacteria bacterium]|nr:MFS transporter [Gammaproteobacteria bacterium]